MSGFKLTFEEENERLAAAVTSYGVGTRSYNRSAEKREMDRQRAEKTATYQPKSNSVEILLCHCRSFQYSHEPAMHKKLKSDHDWRTLQERQSGPEYWSERIS